MCGMALLSCYFVYLMLTVLMTRGFGFDLTLTPAEMLVESGEDLEVNCTLSGDLHGMQVNASMLDVSLPMSDDRVHTVVNERTQTVVFRSLRRIVSHHQVFCRLPGYEKYAQSTVVVADRPVRPTITGCIVWNWSKMNCSWEPAYQDTGIATTQQLTWKISGTSHPKGFKCPHYSGVHNNTCQWLSFDGADSFMSGMPYVMHVTAENRLGSVVSEPYRAQTFMIVKPNPVKTLKVTNISSMAATVSWLPPAKDKTLLCHIVCTSLQGYESDQVLNVTTLYSRLSSLIPFASYSVSVKCIPVYEHGVGSFTAHGYWSNAVDTTFTTQSDVPGRAPAVTTGAYETVLPDTKGRKRIKVYWQPIPSRWRHGNIRLIQVRYRKATVAGDGVWNRVRLSGLSSSVELLSDVDLINNDFYEVTVDAQTEVGFNDSLRLQSVILPSNAAVPPKPTEFSVFADDHGNVYFNWSLVSSASGYTLYWCRHHIHVQQCASDSVLQWILLTGSQSSSVHAFRPPAASAYVGNVYRFAISVERIIPQNNFTVSSGLVWSNCVYNVNKSVSWPVAVSFDSHQLGESLTIVWKHPPCDQTNYISGYIVAYRKLTESNCDSTTPAAWEELRVDGAEDTTVTIRPLDTGEYCVKVKSTSFIGDSHFTEPLKHLVFRTGLTAGVIASIVVAVIFVSIIAALGLFTICRRLKKCKKRMEIPIKVPEYLPSAPPEQVNGSSYTQGMEMVPMLTDSQRDVSEYSDKPMVGQPRSTDHSTAMVDAARNFDGSNSRISPYTKPYLEGTDDNVSGTDTASSFVAKQPKPPESVDKRSPQLTGNETAPNPSRILPVPADSPYVLMPPDASNLPISPYTCIEQTASDGGVAADSTLRADANVRPQDAVIEGTEGTKCDGYIAWSSPQPSA